MPDSRDAQALAALMLLHDSRRSTRVDESGALVPLDEQDRSHWDRGRIARGLTRLRAAEGATGGYLPQAVIAAAHATAPSWADTDWALICAAYDRLIVVADSPIARANRALAVGFRDGFEWDCRRSTKSPTIRGWPDPAPWHRSGRTFCGGRAGVTRLPSGPGRHWSSTAPSLRRHSCCGGWPSVSTDLRRDLHRRVLDGRVWTE